VSEAVLGFEAWAEGGTYQVVFPHWFPILITAICATLAATYSDRSRFSLRTFLIATTLIALVLGTVVWLSG
jgi:hypothetical protein